MYLVEWVFRRRAEVGVVWVFDARIVVHLEGEQEKGVNGEQATESLLLQIMKTAEEYRRRKIENDRRRRFRDFELNSICGR